MLHQYIHIYLLVYTLVAYAYLKRA